MTPDGFKTLADRRWSEYFLLGGRHILLPNCARRKSDFTTETQRHSRAPLAVPLCLRGELPLPQRQAANFTAPRAPAPRGGGGESSPTATSESARRTRRAEPSCTAR